MASYSIKLRSGQLMPMIGVGTSKASDEEIRDSVLKALEIGYRLIDAAYTYCNEAVIGQALEIAFQKGIVKRNELFVTSKLPFNGHSPGKVRYFLEKSLKALGLSYVDLYLIHWPIPSKYVSDDDFYPRDENGKFIIEEIDHNETWKAMEALVEEGLIKNIGVSNFNAKQLKNLYDKAKIKPANLQIECHVYLQQDKLFNLCRNLGISVTAYAPLASPAFPQRVAEKYSHPEILEKPTLMQDPVLKEIAQTRNKTVAQIAMRFLVQRGMAVIPKSVTSARIKENFQIFDFDLTDEEMTRIKSLNKNVRYFDMAWVPGYTDHPQYPFKDEY